MLNRKINSQWIKVLSMKGKIFKMFRRKCKRITYDLKEETDFFGKKKTENIFFED